MLFIMSLTVIGCGGPATTEDATAPVELNVSAAASLTDAAKEIAVLYNQRHPDVKITYNFASSGTLQKQIEEGHQLTFSFLQVKANGCPAGKGRSLTAAVRIFWGMNWC